MLEREPWINVTADTYDADLYRKGFSRYLIRLLRHDKKAPCDSEGALSFEYLRNVCHKGHKRGFQDELIARLCPEDGNVRFQVQLSTDGYNRLLRVRAIQGHSAPQVRNLKFASDLVTCGVFQGDPNGVEEPIARSIFHATKG